MKIVNIVFRVAVIVTLLLTLSASSWSQTSLDNAPVGSQAADEVARARGRFGQPAACRDTTPHKVMFVEVEPGVRLEVVDWGGADKPNTMVLLTGLGDNAHVYDQFAFQFTDDFHVIGITRRGFLPSSQPDPARRNGGYDVDTRARDDIAVLDALGISKATFVGHSLAGSELSKIGEVYKNRVDKLVYLDAHDLADQPPAPPGPASLLFTSDTLKSLWSYQAASARFAAQREPDPAVCIGFEFDRRGAIIGSTTPEWVGPKLFEGVAGSVNPPTNWANIDAPRLGIFAQYTIEAKQAWYWYLTSAEQAEFDLAWPAFVAWRRDTIRKFANKNPIRPLILPGVPHYVYINNETNVVLEMRKFLGLPVGGN